MTKSTSAANKISVVGSALFAAALMTASSRLSAQSPSEKNRVVSEKCKAAMEYYYKDDCASAIRLWEEAIRIDPDQTAPRRMIEVARKKIEEKIKPLSEEVRRSVSDGKYDEALARNAELLTLDATNPRTRAVSAKLAKLSSAAKSIRAKSMSAETVRRAAYDYIYREENMRQALLAARYAAFIDSSDETSRKIKELFEKEYPHLAQMEKDAPGVDVLESKLMSALDNIYDGRHDKAIADCNDALYLEPLSVLAYKRLGSAYWALGDKTKAKAAWSSAAKISPSDEELKKFLKLK